MYTQSDDTTHMYTHSLMTPLSCTHRLTPAHTYAHSLTTPHTSMHTVYDTTNMYTQSMTPHSYTHSLMTPHTSTHTVYDTTHMYTQADTTSTRMYTHNWNACRVSGTVSEVPHGSTYFSLRPSEISPTIIYFTDGKLRYGFQ